MYKQIKIISILILTLFGLVNNSFGYTTLKINIDVYNSNIITNAYNNLDKFRQFLTKNINLKELFLDYTYTLNKVQTSLIASKLSDSNNLGGHSIEWCSNRNIFATSGIISDNMLIYEYNEFTSEVKLIAKTPSEDNTLLDESIDISWNSDCTRIAVAGKDATTIVVYDWNSSFNTLTRLDYITDATHLNSLRTVLWNNDDDRLITVSLLSENVATYIWNETTDTISYETQYVDATYLDMAYEGDVCGNKIVASSRGTNPSLVILNYNKTTHTLSYSTRTTGSGLIYPLDVKFNSDCDRLAVAEYNGNSGFIYTLSGTTLTKQLTKSTNMSGAHTVSWSPDDRYIAFAQYLGNGVTIMDYNKTAGSWNTDFVYVNNLVQTRGVGFSYDGAYMSATDYNNGGASNVLVFRLFNRTEVSP